MRSLKQTDILTGSIPKQLLLFFLPIWFGTLFQQLYNTADTLIVGNFVGTNALAAVGATGAFVNLLVGLFVGLCSGAGVVIAQSWGAHDPEAARCLNWIFLKSRSCTAATAAARRLY